MSVPILDDRPALDPDPLRAAIRQAYRADEAACAALLLEEAAFDDARRRRVQAHARDLAQRVREARGDRLGVEAFLHEYGLSTPEGVMLMCLAEALLRIPDAETADRLIRDKLGAGDWAGHLGRSGSLLVNASTWGLMLTGRFVRVDLDEQGVVSGFTRLVHRMGEPVVRTALLQAMRLLGQHFVLGQTIEQAIARADEAEGRGYRYSYDMLGEAARTAADARGYHDAYGHAIDAIVATARGEALMARPSISIKLSALHPRYEMAQYRRLPEELLPRLVDLAGRGPGRQHRGHHRCRGGGPARAIARSVRAPAGLAGLRRLGRARARGAGLPEARDPRRRLAAGACAPAPPADPGAPGQGRLLGYRDQARPGAGPGLPGADPQARDRRLLSRLRAPAAGRRRCLLSAVRDPQRAYHRQHRRAGRRAARSRVPAPARHGGGALRLADRRRRCHRVPGLRARRQPQRPSALPGAPPAGERRQHLVRQPADGCRHPDRASGRGPCEAARGARRHAASKDRASPRSLRAGPAQRQGRRSARPAGARGAGGRDERRLCARLRGGADGCRPKGRPGICSTRPIARG